VLLALFGPPGLVNDINIIVPDYEDVLGASVAATAVNNPDKLSRSNCTNVSVISSQKSSSDEGL
jgi:hypothetical protein